MLIALRNVDRAESAVTRIWVGLWIRSALDGAAQGEPSGSGCQLLTGDQAIFDDEPSYHAGAKIEVHER